MKNTWMISKNIKNINILEFYYYYLYLINQFNFFFLKNNQNIVLISKFNFKFFHFFKINHNLINKNITFKSINKYLNFKINYKFNSFNVIRCDENSINKSFFYSKKNSIVQYKLFNLFFLFNYSLFNSNFKSHFNFKFFYLYTNSNKIIIIDSTKFLFRWKESYDLLFNIFFYNFNPLVFSSTFFKNETLALNWNYNIFEINLWKFYFPFFIFKLNSYNKKTDFFFDKLFSLNINFFIITDCLYHYKNLHYIKKKKYYSIGLININLDPWLVTYPIISFFESFLTQLFFFKLLIFIERKSIFLKYNIFKNMWLNFLINKKQIKLIK